MKKKSLALALAALMTTSVCAVTACGGNNGGDDTIRYVVYASGGNLDGCERVAEQVNKIVKEELGFEVEFEFLGYNNYTSKVGLYLDTLEDFDMCFTGSILSSLSYSSTAKKYFVDITEKLPQYAPDLYASMSEEIWKAAKIDGKLYGVINEQIFARSVGLCIDTEIANAIGLTQEKIDQEDLTYRDCIVQAMEYIKASDSISDADGDGVHKVPNTTLVIGDAWADIFMQNYALDSLGTSAVVPGIIRAEDGETTVINQYTSPEFLEFAQFCMDMHEAGYIPEEQIDRQITENQRVRITGTYKPGVEAELFNAVGRSFTQFRFGTPLLTTSNVTTSMTAIYRGSKNVDKCLQFLNLMYKNKALYNLLALGEEGIDYEWDDPVAKDSDPENFIYYLDRDYKLLTDWSVGTEFNVYRKEGQSTTVVADTKRLNSESLRSPAYGFTYQPAREMNSNIDNCTKIANDYITKFINGTYDDEMTAQEIIDEMNGKMSSFVSLVISDKQAQLNAFLGK